MISVQDTSSYTAWITASLVVSAGCLPLVTWADDTIKIDTIPFQVEIAETATERERGLMYRTQLPESHGMLFIQPEAKPVGFWMKNTYLPLDILYFDSTGQLIELYANVPPCTAPACPIYASTAAVKYILEIKGGSVSRLGLKLGARLQFD